MEELRRYIQIYLFHQISSINHNATKIDVPQLLSDLRISDSCHLLWAIVKVIAYRRSLLGLHDMKVK